MRAGASIFRRGRANAFFYCERLREYFKQARRYVLLEDMPLSFRAVKRFS